MLSVIAVGHILESTILGEAFMSASESKLDLATMINTEIGRKTCSSMLGIGFTTLNYAT